MEWQNSPTTLRFWGSVWRSPLPLPNQNGVGNRPSAKCTATQLSSACQSHHRLAKILLKANCFQCIKSGRPGAGRLLCFLSWNLLLLLCVNCAAETWLWSQRSVDNRLMGMLSAPQSSLTRLHSFAGKEGANGPHITLPNAPRRGTVQGRTGQLPLPDL